MICFVIFSWIIIIYSQSNTHLFTGPLRPFPRDVAMRIPGYFKQCDRDRCVGPRCTFTHNNLELQEWNREKKELLYC